MYITITAENGLLRYLFGIFFTISIANLSSAQSTAGLQYSKMQQQMATGWNTWNTSSVLSHVKLPEGLAINIALKNYGQTYNRYLSESYLSYRIARTEHVEAGYHAYDGSYTKCTVSWEGTILQVESAHAGNDLVLLLTPLKIPARKPNVIIEGGMLWNMPGLVYQAGNLIKAKTGTTSWEVRGTASPVFDPMPINNPYLSFMLDTIVGISVGQPRSLEQIKIAIKKQQTSCENNLNKYGDAKEIYVAQQSALSWNTIYDPERKAVFAPVSRFWSSRFGGNYVLFGWDSYLSGLMAGFDNKTLAYANVIEVTKTIDRWGMVPNFISTHGVGSPDRSQPPVGSMAVHELYKKYKEKWLLELTYDRLLTWNRWWPKHRDTNGFLCWGSDAIEPNANLWQSACYESGLDNSPMYDKVPFNKQTHQMALADVGLLGLYIADCKYLAALADVMQKPLDAAELRERATHYSNSLQQLWNDKAGMFLNKRTDNGEWSYRLSPTLFYPLLGGAASPLQAERMVNEHLLNTNEFWGEWVLPSVARNDTAFKQQDYWRGRIWGPMNFLVYKGLKQYPFPEATKALAEKSGRLLEKNWHDSKGIYENYHISGVGRLPDEMPNKSDNFYHWGGLLGYMFLLEQQEKE